MPASKKTNKVSVFIGIVSATGFLLATPGLYREARATRREQETAGLLTRQQIYARSGLISQMLAPDARELTQNATLQSVFGLDGAKLECWSIDCCDDKGEVINHALWNARTGKLLSVSGSQFEDGKTQRLPLDASEAATEAARWLEKLGLTDSQRPWHLAAKPKLYLMNWRVQFARGQERRSVILNMRTHALVSTGALKAGNAA